jgi:hypothetical protein
MIVAMVKSRMIQRGSINNSHVVIEITPNSLKITNMRINKIYKEQRYDKRWTY